MVPVPADRRSPFGHALIALRAPRSLSQSKLAERAGFDHSYISRLESGSRTPTREAVAQIADALALSDGERDRLLVAAGFAPTNPQLLQSEPEVVALIGLLASPTLPAATAEVIRDQLAGIVRLATSLQGGG